MIVSVPFKEVDKDFWVQSFSVNDGNHTFTGISGTNVSDLNFGNFHPKIQLTVYTTYDSDRENTTFMVTVTNPLPYAAGVELTNLTDVMVQAHLANGTSLDLMRPLNMSTGSSESITAPLEYFWNCSEVPPLPCYDGYFFVFAAWGTDADGDYYNVEILVSLFKELPY